MFRGLTALGAVALFAAAATAQPGRLPLSPGVTPASPIGPGTQFIAPSFAPAAPGLQILPILSPWGYPATPVYGTAFGGFGGYGYPYGGVNVFPPAINITQSVNVGGPLPVARVVVPVKDFPATLALQFPNPAEVWVNGKKLSGDAALERVITSPVLRAGEEYTFAIRARWASGGKTFEATRTLTLASGDRSRLLVLSGAEVGG